MWPSPRSRRRERRLGPATAPVRAQLLALEGHGCGQVGSMPRSWDKMVRHTSEPVEDGVSPSMDQAQLEKVKTGQGFIAALDQSGGSTPKALKLYGIEESEYSGDEQMFDLMHAMRSRIITSPSFGGDRVLGAILFEMTMDRQIEGVDTGQYLWGTKQVVPFLKVDKGLADEADGVQVMKPIDGLDELLGRAVTKGMFGTKMRSVIKLADSAGITRIVGQQFEIGRQIVAAGLVPIIEPEVDIHSPQKG